MAFFSTAPGRPQLRALIGGLSLTILAACSLPEPDGTEAVIIERSQGLPALAPAEGNKPQAVVRNGLLMDPNVRAAASSVAASADEVRVQRAALFPSLGLSLGGGTGEASSGRGEIELSGKQLILDFGNTKRAVTSADLDLQINYIAFQQAVDDATYDILESYDSVRMYVLLLGVRQKQVAAMRDLHAKVGERTDLGAIASSDILETRKRLQAAEFLVLDTQLNLAEARDRLARLSGQPRGGRVPLLKVGACSVSENSDELQKARLELAKAEIDLESANKARAPRAYVSPIARKSRDKGGISFGLDIGVDSDLLQGGALTARANMARNTRDGADANMGTARRNMALDAAKLKREISAAGQKTAMLNRQIALLVQTRTLYRSQYFDLGTREISELLDNEEEYYNRKAELIELDSELTANRIECAIRDQKLRAAMKIEGSSLYGYPLKPGAI